LLNARFLIYRHKYENSKPTVAAFIRTINCVKIIEKRIAKKNGKLKQHFEKWIILLQKKNGISEIKVLNTNLESVFLTIICCLFLSAFLFNK